MIDHEMQLRIKKTGDSLQVSPLPKHTHNITHPGLPALKYTPRVRISVLFPGHAAPLF